MIKLIRDFITKSYFCFSPMAPSIKEECGFEDLWLNIAKDFNKSFEKIKEGYEKRN
jgi:hypothetical protein